MSTSSSSANARTLLLVIGLIGGLMLLMFLGCGGLIYIGYLQMKPMIGAMQTMVADVQATEALGKQFLGDIRDGKLEAAYGLTSADFKNRMSVEAFTEFVKAHPQLKDKLEVELDPESLIPAADSEKGEYHFQVKSGPQGRSEFVLKFVKENGIWYVNGLERDTLGMVDQAAKSFVDSVQAGWKDSAYQMTTESFRTRWGRSKLEEFLKEHPFPKNYLLRAPVDVDGQGESYLVVLDEQATGKPVCELVIRKSRDAWHVDDLRAVGPR